MYFFFFTFQVNILNFLLHSCLVILLYSINGTILNYLTLCNYENISNFEEHKVKTYTKTRKTNISYSFTHHSCHSILSPLIKGYTVCMFTVSSCVTYSYTNKFPSPILVCLFEIPVAHMPLRNCEL